MKQSIHLKKIHSEKISLLKEEYKIFQLDILKFKAKEEYITLFIQLDNLDYLMEHQTNKFDTLISAISIYLEEFLENNFLRWNIYMIFVISKKVEKEIKYQIENDTYFARKILEDEYCFELTDENINKLISKYITFTDLELTDTPIKSKKYISDSKIYTELKGIVTLKDDKRDEILTLLERGIKNEI